jgi:hypothetical protein
MFTAAEAIPVPGLASVTLSVGSDDPEPPICSTIKAFTPPSAGGAEPVICGRPGTAACAGVRRFAGDG